MVKHSAEWVRPNLLSLKVTGLAALNEQEPDRLSDWLDAYFPLEDPAFARHAMGRRIMNKTGNAAAVQRQPGHSNVAFLAAVCPDHRRGAEDLLDDCFPL